MRSPKHRTDRKLAHLWLAVSGHGHGHLVQVAPLVRALQARFPRLRIAVQSTLPATLLQETLGAAIEIHHDASDVGMLMAGPLTVLPAESLAAHRQFHETWDRRLAHQLSLFDAFRPDLVVGDIPYLPLAAAKVRDIPAVAVCSLNWADVLEHYCDGIAGADEIVATLRGHYAGADLFLRPAPSMPMRTLDNTVAIGPLVSVGVSRTAALRRRLQLPTDARVVLVTLGGIAGDIAIARWPSFEETVFLVPAAWLDATVQAGTAGQFRAIESTGLSFADLFASVDALVTKPGYGAFAGAGCSALPVLYAERGDWPEEPFLTAWLATNGQCASIDRQTLLAGNFEAPLLALLAEARKEAVAADGARQGLERILSLLGA